MQTTLVTLNTLWAFLIGGFSGFVYSLKKNGEFVWPHTIKSELRYGFRINFGSFKDIFEGGLAAVVAYSVYTQNLVLSLMILAGYGGGIYLQQQQKINALEKDAKDAEQAIKELKTK